MPSRDNSSQQGVALVAVLILVAVLMVLVVSFAGITAIEMATTRSSMKSFQGFYAAEAGLNARADEFRQVFVGGGLPSGTAPTSGSPAPCAGSNLGSGDFACSSFLFQGREVQTFVEESSLSSNSIVIPRGETFLNLFAREYHYIVYSQAINPDGSREASLEMHFKSRTVPLFQFSAFYNKDLEILPAASMLLSGPVHSNTNLYLGSSGTLDITGQVTAVGTLYNGRKDADTCMVGPVRVIDPETLYAIPGCSTGRSQVSQASVTAWDKMVEVGIDPVSVPGPEILDPSEGQPYWEKANARIVLNLKVDPPEIEVRDVDGNEEVSKTVHVLSCGAATYSETLFDNREGGYIRMLDLNMQALLTCPQLGQIIGVSLSSVPSLPIVLYLAVDGPDSSGVNLYGVRLRNAGELTSPLPQGAVLLGLTVATDQPVYIQGNYNAVNKKPAAVLGDTINVLSSNWSDASSSLSLASRVPAATTINAAFLAGTTSTGGAEGAAGQDLGGYSGGVENFMRLHENWNGTVTLTYRGSFVSLFTPRHVDGPWVNGSPQSTAPNRDWNYDTDFEDPELLPPMSPQFVYLRQELFLRRFEL